MRYVLLSFWLALRRALCRRRFWLFLLLIVLGAAAVRQTPSPAADGVVTVGVVLPETGGEEFWARLSARENAVVRFRRTDEAELIRQMSTSGWDCGLILRPDFDARLDEGDFEGLLTLVTGPGSTVFPLVRETAAAVLLELGAPEIALTYIRDRPLAEEGALEALRPRLEEILPADRRVEVTMETLDGTALEPVALAEEGTTRIFLGLTAVLLLVWALSAAVDLGRWRESGPAARLLALRGRAEVLMPRLLGMLLPPFFCAGAGVLALTGTWRGAAMLLPYLMAVGALALLLSGARRCWRVLPALLPFAAAAGVLLSPVFLDLTLLFPVLEPVSRFMPVTLYLNGWAGDGAAPLKLLAMALLFGCFGVGWDPPRRRQPL